MNRQVRAYIFLALAMSIAGSAVVVGKYMVSAMPVFLAAELGILTSLMFLLPPVLLGRQKRERLDRKTHLILLLQALCGVVLYRICIFQGLRYTSASAGGLISSAAPVFIVLMAFFLLREKMTGKRAAGAGCVCVGILAVNLYPFLTDSFQAVSAFKGNCLVLAAVVCEAAFSVMSKVGCKPMSALFRTTMVTLYACVCLLPFSLHEALGYDFGSMDATTFFSIGYYGFFVSFLSYVLWFKGIECVPAGIAASFTGFVPLSCIFLSWAILNEQMNSSHYAGLLFLLTGIGLACLPDGARRVRA